ncbi:MAG: hypothetical protein GX273_09415 [Bacteroidales bacterium]|nr:hypothetical protein [Bacteroidales bacterium]
MMVTKEEIQDMLDEQAELFAQMLGTVEDRIIDRIDRIDKHNKFSKDNFTS